MVVGSVGVNPKSIDPTDRDATHAAGSPSAIPMIDQPGSARQHHGHDPPSLRAERHADADLPRALGDAVGQQAVQTNTGQRQRQQPESAGERRHHALLDHRRLDLPREQPHIDQCARHRSIAAPAELPMPPARRTSRPDRQRRRKVAVQLRIRDVDGGRRRTRRPAAFVFLTSPTISRSVRRPLTFADRCWPTGF